MSDLIVCCTEVADPNWRWIEGSFKSNNVSFQFVRCTPRSWLERNVKFVNFARLRGCLDAVLLAKRQNASVLVTHGPTLAAWCGLFARMFGLKARLLAHSFNFTDLPGKLKIVIFKLGLRRADRLVTFSRIERSVYARAFDLPEDRFEFVYWGANPPKIVGDNGFGDYVSSIGGNARDYGTLMEAARRVPQIPFIVIGRPENFEGLDIPQNVISRLNTPLDYAMNVLNYSRFMVLPLTNSEVPCGHVTIVAAMHLGKAMIVTASSGVDDYVIANRNALVAPARDAEAMSAAIDTLWNDEALCNSLGENGKHFARSNCTEQRIAELFEAYLNEVGVV